MRKYINKGIIIVLLILANLILPINAQKPDYEKSEIKKRFTLISEKKDTRLKRAKKIDIAKVDTNMLTSKNEIINKVLTASSTSFINNYYDNEGEDPFDLISDHDDEANENEEAIVLESEKDNPLLDKWSSSNASVYYKDEKNLVLSSISGKNIVLRPKRFIAANKEYISLDFSGCSDAKLKLMKNGTITEVNLSGASDFKYFFVSDELRGSSIDSIEFISDNKSEFYLSIGEIKYE